MRLIPRQRHQHRTRRPRIAVSQAEITADLHYPAASRQASQAHTATARGGR
jgi:hypothetical protein